MNEKLALVAALAFVSFGCTGIGGGVVMPHGRFTPDPNNESTAT